MSMAKPCSSAENYHDLTALDIDKKPVDFKTLRGKVQRGCRRPLRAGRLPLPAAGGHPRAVVSPALHSSCALTHRSARATGRAGSQRGVEMRPDSSELQGALRAPPSRHPATPTPRHRPSALSHPLPQSAAGVHCAKREVCRSGPHHPGLPVQPGGRAGRILVHTGPALAVASAKLCAAGWHAPALPRGSQSAP